MSRTGKYGVALPYDTEALSSTSQPCVRWECTHSYTRRDLPTPGLAHECDHLAMPGAGLFQGLLHDHQFLIPPDKARQAPRCSSLQAPPDSTGTDQLEHLHRLHEPFDG